MRNGKPFENPQLLVKKRMVQPIHQQSANLTLILKNTRTWKTKYMRNHIIRQYNVTCKISFPFQSNDTLHLQTLIILPIVYNS